MRLLLALTILALVAWLIRDSQWYREMIEHERDLKRDLAGDD